MCGIIAYLGAGNAVERVVNGLKDLEYRGYDSAGVAAIVGKRIKTVKSVGHVRALCDKISAHEIASNIAIGHTRWATHGGVSEKNCHPHVSANGRIAVVHNGIIENYRELRAELEHENIAFKTDTDTEVIPNLIQHILGIGRDLLGAVRRAVPRLHGSYAFLVIDAGDPETIIAVKNGSQPLVITVQNGDVFVSSDTPTATANGGAVYVLEDGEMATLRRDSVTFYMNGKCVVKKPLAITTTPAKPSKEGYATFMEKEIREIPTVVANIEGAYRGRNLHPLRGRIFESSCVHLVACGTSFHACLYIANLLEARGTRARCYVASEFLHTRPHITDRDVAIVISQSGETADTLLAMKMLKGRGIYTAAICNVEASSIWRYADVALPTVAGVEVAVASTKAFIAQCLVGEILVNGGILEGVLVCGKAIIDRRADLVDLVKRHGDAKKIFFLGKGVTTIVAMESALKVKEITYRHCEGIAAGELKHGTLALVDDKTLCIFLLSNDEIANGKIENAMHEVAARGARVHVLPASVGIMSVIYAQLFALDLCLSVGLDPDKPRNLAKSVTVD